MASSSAPASERYKLDNNCIYLDDLEISFRRTIRVPANLHMAKLPPDMGAFPLHQTKYFAKNIPGSMTAKGGIFLPHVS